MNTFRSFVTKHLVLFVFCSIIAWLAVALIFSGIASAVLDRPYGDAFALTIGRLAATICCLLLVWHLGWLKMSGIARLGNWLVWLIAVGSMVYSAGASLLAFYGAVAFDFSSLIRLPDARAVVMVSMMVGLSEEILFRGLVLCALSRAWGNTRLGVTGSIVLTSLLFAVLHITQVLTDEIPITMALLLTVQAFVTAFWWGVVVLFGRSIWPAVMLHFVGNAIVAVQGVTAAMIAPGILAYERVLWFSMPLGVLCIVLLTRILRRPGMSLEQGAN